MQAGNFIVVEGTDAAGKKTQTKLLVDYLVVLSEEFGRPFSVRKFDFPRYQSPTGRIIGRALKGVYGDFRHLHPHLASALYTVDRAGVKEELRTHLEHGVVVCDRYTPSNIAFQSAKLPESERDQFVRELEEIEYIDVGLPRPTLVIFLDVPIAVAKKLALGRGEDLDQHEADLAYQEEVAQVYRKLSGERKDWFVVNCAPEGEMLSREAIHALVVEIVNTNL